MTDVLYSLLEEPLFTVDRGAGGGDERRTLPDLLAALGHGQPLEMVALQPHQSHPWHAFLVQLAALAAVHAADREVARSPADWRRLLRELAGGGSEPWCLVVPDLDLPAFLQPPVPEGTLDGFKGESRFPDEIDILVTAKNHDLKVRRMESPRPEHWVFALVSLQTAQGYSGRDNYGIARMNGGFSSRPCVGAAPSLVPGERFGRDVAAWLDARETLLGGDFPYPPEGGRKLLWLEPWNGEGSLSLADCDPFFLEVCRRVRLVEEGRVVRARTASTKVPRIEARAALGATGDVWTPVRRKDGAALTVGGSGFSYPLLQEILFGGDFAPGAALTIRDEDGPQPIVVAQALVRGQGTTDGYRERSVPLPRRTVLALQRRDERIRLGDLARRRVEAAHTVERRVLRPALLTLLQAAPSQLDFQDDRDRGWVEKLDQRIDRIFFDRLWNDLELDPHEADQGWERELHRLGREVLEQAIESVAFPAARRYRVIAAAEGVYEGAARHQLKSAFPENPQGDQDGAQQRA